MKKGKVRWFNEQKGYGFIICEDGEKDVFVHVREIRKANINLSLMVPDQVVSFISNQGPRGLFATDVKLSA
jgi:cold shock protein